ncbi:MAG: hypothetical protein ABUT20_32475 [Bacteroidota bacterium]
MPEELNYITASCSISKGFVRMADELLFKNDETGVNDFLLSAYRHFKIDYPKFYKMDNLSKLGLLATEILLKDNFKKEKYRPEEVSVVFANSNASLDADLNYWESVKNIPSPALFVYTLPNIVVGEICIRNNFKGENAFFVQENFDAAFIHFYVSNLMDKHKIATSVCGWVDILGEEYKAVLYLVQKEKKDKAVPFTIDTINNIYDLTNG